MRVLACAALWGLLAVFSCVACVDSLVPAFEAAPVPAPEVSQDLPIRLVGNIYTNRPEGDLGDEHPRGSLSLVGGGYQSQLTLWAAPAPRFFYNQPPSCRSVFLGNAAHSGGTTVCGGERAVIGEQRVRRRGRIVTTTDTVLTVGGREMMRIHGRAHEHDPSKTQRVD